MNKKKFLFSIGILLLGLFLVLSSYAVLYPKKVQAAGVTVNVTTYDNDCNPVGGIKTNLAGEDKITDANGKTTYAFSFLNTTGSGLYAFFDGNLVRQFETSTNISSNEGTYEGYCNPSGCYIESFGGTVGPECLSSGGSNPVPSGVKVYGYTYDENCNKAGGIRMDLSGTIFYSSSDQDNLGYYEVYFPSPPGLGTDGYGLAAFYDSGLAQEFENSVGVIRATSGSIRSYCSPDGCWMEGFGSDYVGATCSSSGDNRCGYTLDILYNGNYWQNMGGTDAQWEVGKEYVLEAQLKDMYSNIVNIVDDKNYYMDGVSGVEWTFEYWDEDINERVLIPESEFKTNKYFDITPLSSNFDTKVKVVPKDSSTKLYKFHANANLAFTSYNCGQTPGSGVPDGGVSVKVDTDRTIIDDYVGHAMAANTIYRYQIDRAGQIFRSTNPIYNECVSGGQTWPCYAESWTDTENIGKFVASVTCKEGEYYTGDSTNQSYSFSALYYPSNIESGSMGSGCSSQPLDCGQVPSCTARTTPSTFFSCDNINGCVSDYQIYRCGNIQNASSTCQNWCMEAQLPGCSVTYYSKRNIAVSKEWVANIVNPSLEVDKTELQFKKCIDTDDPAEQDGTGDIFNIYNGGSFGSVNWPSYLKAIWENQGDVSDRLSIETLESGDIFNSSIDYGWENRKDFKVILNTTYLNNNKPDYYGFTDENFATIKIKGVHAENESILAINSPKEVNIKVRYDQCSEPKVTCSTSPSEGYPNDNFEWTATYDGYCPQGRSVRYQWFEEADCENGDLLASWTADNVISKAYSALGVKRAKVRADCGDGTFVATSGCCSVNVIERPAPSCTITGPNCVNADEEFDLAYTTYNADSATVNPGDLSASIGKSQILRITETIGEPTKYTMNVSGAGGDSSCEKTINICGTGSRNLKGIFITKQVVDATGDQEVNISQDSHVVNNPPPGFNDLFAPLWRELVP